MIGKILENEIDKAEDFLGASMEYLRDMQEHSFGAALKFFMFMPLANHAKAATPEQLAVARLIGARSEDCGPCVQATVNGSLAASVDPEIIKAVLDERLEDLPEVLREVFAFASAVVTTSAEAVTLSEGLTQRLGRAAVIELSLAIATARLFPTVKRGMGYAQACSRTVVEVG